MSTDDIIARLETELALLRTERALMRREGTAPIELSALLAQPPLSPSEPLGDFSGMLAVGPPEDRLAVSPGFPVEMRRNLTSEQVPEELADWDSVVVLRPQDFPFWEVWPLYPDLPLDVCLDGLEPEDALSLAKQCGLFAHLTFFDRVVVEDDRVWNRLRSQAGWAEGQRLTGRDAISGQHTDAAAFERRGDRDPIQYWQARADALAASSPHQAVGSVRHGRRANKRLFLQQREVLKAHLPEQAGTRVLELGCGVGRIASLLSRDIDYTGADIAEAAITTAARNFPGHHFEAISGPSLPWPDGHFDLSLTVAVLHHNEVDVRRPLLEEMVRVTRVGGHLLLLEDVVGASRPGGNVFPMSIDDLLRDIERSRGRFALEHLESVGYDHISGARSALLRLRRMA